MALPSLSDSGRLISFCVFHRELGSNDEAAGAAERADRILYYYPAVDLEAQLKHVGLCEGLLGFSGIFSRPSSTRSPGATHIVSWDRKRYVIVEHEPSVFAVLAYQNEVLSSAHHAPSEIAAIHAASTTASIAGGSGGGSTLGASPGGGRSLSPSTASVSDVMLKSVMRRLLDTCDLFRGSITRATTGRAAPRAYIAHVQELRAKLRKARREAGESDDGDEGEQQQQQASHAGRDAGAAADSCASSTSLTSLSPIGTVTDSTEVGYSRNSSSAAGEGVARRAALAARIDVLAASSPVTALRAATADYLDFALHLTDWGRLSFLEAYDSLRYFQPPPSIWKALQAFTTALETKHPAITHTVILYDGQVVWGRHHPGVHVLYHFLRQVAFQVAVGGEEALCYDIPRSAWAVRRVTANNSGRAGSGGRRGDAPALAHSYSSSSSASLHGGRPSSINEDALHRISSSSSSSMASSASTSSPSPVPAASPGSATAAAVSPVRNASLLRYGGGGGSSSKLSASASASMGTAASGGSPRRTMSGIPTVSASAATAATPSTSSGVLLKPSVSLSASVNEDDVAGAAGGGPRSSGSYFTGSLEFGGSLKNISFGAQDSADDGVVISDGDAAAAVGWGIASQQQSLTAWSSPLVESTLEETIERRAQRRLDLLNRSTRAMDGKLPFAAAESSRNGSSSSNSGGRVATEGPLVRIASSRVSSSSLSQQQGQQFSHPLVRSRAATSGPSASSNNILSGGGGGGGLQRERYLLPSGLGFPALPASTARTSGTRSALTVPHAWPLLAAPVISNEYLSSLSSVVAASARTVISAATPPAPPLSSPTFTTSPKPAAAVVTTPTPAAAAAASVTIPTPVSSARAPAAVATSNSVSAAPILVGMRSFFAARAPAPPAITPSSPSKAAAQVATLPNGGSTAKSGGVSASSSSSTLLLEPSSVPPPASVPSSSSASASTATSTSIAGINSATITPSAGGGNSARDSAESQPTTGPPLTVSLSTGAVGPAYDPSQAPSPPSSSAAAAGKALSASSASSASASGRTLHTQQQSAASSAVSASAAPRRHLFCPPLYANGASMDSPSHRLLIVQLGLTSLLCYLDADALSSSGRRAAATESGTTSSAASTAAAAAPSSSIVAALPKIAQQPLPSAPKTTAAAAAAPSSTAPVVSASAATTPRAGEHAIVYDVDPARLTALADSIRDVASASLPPIERALSDALAAGAAAATSSGLEALRHAQYDSVAGILQVRGISALSRRPIAAPPSQATPLSSIAADGELQRHVAAALVAVQAACFDESSSSSGSGGAVGRADAGRGGRRYSGAVDVCCTSSAHSLARHVAMMASLHPAPRRTLSALPRVGVGASSSSSPGAGRLSVGSTLPPSGAAAITGAAAVAAAGGLARPRAGSAGLGSGAGGSVGGTPPVLLQRDSGGPVVGVTLTREVSGTSLSTVPPTHARRPASSSASSALGADGIDRGSGVRPHHRALALPVTEEHMLATRYDGAAAVRRHRHWQTFVMFDGKTPPLPVAMGKAKELAVRYFGDEAAAAQ